MAACLHTNKKDITGLPRRTIDLTISDMTAPMAAGTYYSYWMIGAGRRKGYDPPNRDLGR